LKDELKISAENGIHVQLCGRSYYLDPKRTVPGTANFISHAHTDHLPRRSDEKHVIASSETVALANMRLSADLMRTDEEGLSMFEAGHVQGSRMALIERGLSILYTGDFCTRDKLHMRGARPVRTDILIMESTYGRPCYSFPDPIELSAVIRDWCADTLEGGRSVVFNVYPLGKAQEIEYMLSGFPLFCDASVHRHNAILSFPSEVPEMSHAGREPAVFIVSSLKSLSSLPRGLSRPLIAGASGWALDSRSGRTSTLDENFPLSDHCDYSDLLAFVSGCEPSLVLTTHGFSEEFAADIKRELGTEARALKDGTVSLSAHF